MSVYMISYDLIDNSKDYDDLYEGIKSYGTWWHHLESVWMIETKEKTSQIRDKLMNKLSDNDKLFVVKLQGGWASYNIKKSGTDWLKELTF
jgi:hypothetical protein